MDGDGGWGMGLEGREGEGRVSWGGRGKFGVKADYVGYLYREF